MPPYEYSTTVGTNKGLNLGPESVSDLMDTLDHSAQCKGMFLGIFCNVAFLFQPPLCTEIRQK